MDKKEMTMETRLLLAFVLVGIVLVGWNYIYKPPLPPETPASTAPVQNTQPAAEASKASPAPTPVEVADIPGQIQATKVEEFDIENDLYKVRFSNQGAAVQHWILKKYKDGKGKPLDLVNTRALAKVPAPFALAFRNQTPHADLNKGLFQVQRTAD